MNVTLKMASVHIGVEIQKVAITVIVQHICNCIQMADDVFVSALSFLHFFFVFYLLNRFCVNVEDTQKRQSTIIAL